MALPFGDPRKRWWTLMGGGQGAPLPDRFEASVEDQLLRHTGLGPHYGTSGDIDGAKNNAAINAVGGYKNPYPGLDDPTWSVASAFPAADKSPKKGGKKLKYILEALQELEGPEPPKLAGGKFGRAKPSALGFSLPSMGGRLGEQEAMAKARREEELRRRMKLMGGGY
jgi:hypothetical protein